MHNYSEIFRARARQYHTAMQTFPQARDAEFLALLEDLPATAMDVLDVPSGGGYLSGYLPSPLRLSSCDFSAGFAETGVPLASTSQLPYPADSFDAVLSLTGLHHVNVAEQEAFLAECYRVLRNGGHVLVGEVLAGTPVDAFLNDFVHRHNSQGHTGEFLDASFLNRLRHAGFSDAGMIRRDYVWRFPDVAALCFYCRNMFGIDRADDDMLKNGLREFLNYRSLPGGGIELPWQLVFFQALKR